MRVQLLCLVNFAISYTRNKDLAVGVWQNECQLSIWKVSPAGYGYTVHVCVCVCVCARTHAHVWHASFTLEPLCCLNVPRMLFFFFFLGIFEFSAKLLLMWAQIMFVCLEKWGARPSVTKAWKWMWASSKQESRFISKAESCHHATSTTNLISMLGQKPHVNYYSTLNKLHSPELSEIPEPSVLVSIATILMPPSFDAVSSSSVVTIFLRRWNCYTVATYNGNDNDEFFNKKHC